jgi:hypothetical protein
MSSCLFLLIVNIFGVISMCSNNAFQFSMPQFATKVAVTGAMIGGAAACGFAAVAATSLAAKVSLVATAVFLSGASWGSVGASLTSSSTDEYLNKLPRASVIAGGFIFQACATIAIQELFSAIVAAGRDVLYETITGNRPRGPAFSH